MRCAFFAATEHGIELGRRLRSSLSDTVDIYAKKARVNSADIMGYEKMTIAVASAFSAYDALVFCTSVGIAVRMLAPHVKSKLTDPAVVVVDEQAVHAISLLSGHVGGGNDLTLRVAGVLGAEPVITTATDVNNTLAPDALAARLGLRPLHKEQIQVINSSLLTGRKPVYWVDKELKNAEYWLKVLSAEGISVAVCQAESLLQQEQELTVFVTERKMPLRQGMLCLVPRRLIAGIGCRRGVQKALIKSALEQACEMAGQSIDRVSMLASTVVKSDEKGLLQFANDLGIEIKFFANEALQAKIDAYSLEESAFVKKQIGVGNISAAAALCCVDKGRFALDKTKFEKVTVALVWEK